MPVNVFAIEPMRKTVSASIGRPAAASARPTPAKRASSP